MFAISFIAIYHLDRGERNVKNIFQPRISRSTGRSTYAFVSWLRGVSMERGNKEKFVTESLMPAG